MKSHRELDMKEEDVRGMMEGTPTEVSLSAPVGEEQRYASSKI